MSQPSSLPAAQWLTLVSLAAVTAFVGANLYAQREMVAIDANALALVDSIAPKIDRLTTLRGAIYRMDRGVRDAVADRCAPSEARQIAKRERALIGSEFAGLSDLPRLGPAVEAFARRAEQTLVLAGAGDLTGARSEIESLGDAVAAVDEVIHASVTSTASDAARDGARIARLRKHASTVAYALNSVAAALSLSMLAIAVRITRQNERLVSEHARAVEERALLTERRATELDAFAARVAHDLKNPLSTIGLRMAILRRPDMEPAAQEEAKRVELTLNRLVKIIDGLLAFSSSGGTPDLTASTPVLPVVREVVREIEPEAESAGVDVQVTAITPWTSVACSTATLSMIVENLVRNAVKFVVDGDEPAHVVLIRADRRDAIVRVEVADNGPGVPSAQQAMIFEPYARGGDAHQPGLGIGLATVKRLVEAYGGSVGVSSTVGMGSRFWIELPAADAPR